MINSMDYDIFLIFFFQFERINLVKNMEGYDIRFDIWSLGIIMVIYIY